MNINWHKVWKKYDAWFQHDLPNGVPLRDIKEKIQSLVDDQLKSQAALIRRETRAAAGLTITTIKIVKTTVFAEMDLEGTRALRILLGQLVREHGHDSNVRSDQMSQEEWESLMDIYDALKTLGV